MRHRLLLDNAPLCYCPDANADIPGAGWVEAFASYHGWFATAAGGVGVALVLFALTYLLAWWLAQGSQYR